jgi:PAS domain S-box-containing protein
MSSSRFAAEVERLRAMLRGAKRQEAVAALREHLDSFAVAALAADGSSRFVAANPPAEELTGYSTAELTALSVLDLTPVPNTADGRGLWDAFISTGEQQGHYDVRRKDGSFVRVQYWAYANVAPGIHLSLVIPEATLQA